MRENNVQLLKENEDFRVELIDWQGRPAVRKSIQPTTPPERAARLQNEAYGMEFLNDLTARNRDLKLYIPELFALDKSRLIREYIDATPIVTPGMTVNNKIERAGKLAKLLADIDRIEPYGDVNFIGHFDYQDIRKNFPKWTKEPLETGMISQPHVGQLVKMLDELEIFLGPRITHGDLSPHAHAYLLSDGRIAFIDLENFTPNGARYYDVARVYVRLFSFDEEPVAKAFLKTFLDHADKADHQAEMLMAIFLQRTLGMQYDAWYDAGKGVEYKDRAKQLFELVLQGKIELLYQ